MPFDQFPSMRKQGHFKRQAGKSNRKTGKPATA
jgi:hypothetical protein